MKKTRITALLLLILTFAVLFVSVSSSAETATVGDIDGDGDVDFADAAKVFDYVAGNGNLSLFELSQADINDDGSITIADAAQILHYANGFLSVLPFEKRGKGRLVIISYPDKTEYTEGEEFDMTGFRLAVDYNDGTTEEVTDYTVSDITDGSGVKIVIVNRKDQSIGFVITVYPD